MAPPHLPAWINEYGPPVAACVAAWLHGWITPSPRERAALRALKGNPMQLDVKKAIALLPLVPEAFKIEQELTDKATTAEQKAEEVIPQLVKDVPAAFAACGASPGLVAALGNPDLYENVYGVAQAIETVLPALEALVAKLEHKGEPTPEQHAEQPAA